MAVARPFRRVRSSAKKRHVAQGGRHEEEARLGQGEQGHLPGHAPIAVGVPVELVHHDVVHGRVRPVAQRDVGQHLGGAAQDGSVAVDGGVSGGQAHVLGAQLAAEGHPLLVDQGLDGAGVDGAPPVGEGGEVEGGGHERLPRAGGRVQDDVLFLEELEDGLFLRRIEGEPLARDVVEEQAEQLVAPGLAPGQDVVERTGHGPRIVGQFALPPRGVVTAAATLPGLDSCGRGPTT